MDANGEAGLQPKVLFSEYSCVRDVTCNILTHCVVTEVDQTNFQAEIEACFFVNC